jgi:REP-associated tyrosine transposase
MKVAFTKAFRASNKEVGSAHPTLSRERHREAEIWQRRFWEHVIQNENDLAQHFDYLHYNAVKHGLVSCPHAWPHSSFQRWVERKVYEPSWCCCCGGTAILRPYRQQLDKSVGE